MRVYLRIPIARICACLCETVSRLRCTYCMRVTPTPPMVGFSANYIDARTRVLDPKPALAGPLGEPGSAFPLVWPSPFEAESA